MADLMLAPRVGVPASPRLRCIAPALWAVPPYPGPLKDELLGSHTRSPLSWSSWGPHGPRQSAQNVGQLCSWEAARAARPGALVRDAPTRWGWLHGCKEHGTHAKGATHARESARTRGGRKD